MAHLIVRAASKEIEMATNAPAQPKLENQDSEVVSSALKGEVQMNSDVSKEIEMATNAPAQPKLENQDSEIVSSTSTGEAEMFPHIPDTSRQNSNFLPKSSGKSGSKVIPVVKKSSGNQIHKLPAIIENTSDAPQVALDQSTAQIFIRTPAKPSGNANSNGKMVQVTYTGEETKMQKKAWSPRSSRSRTTILSPRSPHPSVIRRAVTQNPNESTQALKEVASLMKARAYSVVSKGGVSAEGHAFAAADTSLDGQLDFKEFENLPFFVKMRQFIGAR